MSSESAHIRNLLSQSHNLKNDQVLEESQYRSLPRFGLRGASSQIIESLYSLIFDTFSEYNNNDILIKYCMYADSDEASFYSSAGNIDDCTPVLQGDFFESFPDLFITIYVSNNHIYGNPPPAPDAIYAHDSDNEYDMGEIVMKVCLPPTLDASLAYLQDHRLEIAGTLAHEMQHVVQKHCYGEPLGDANTQDVLSHALDKNEIDARVEEIIAGMEDDIAEEQSDYFKSKLEAYVDKYLTRNLTESTSSPPDLKETMIKQHLKVYFEKMEGIL